MIGGPYDYGYRSTPTAHVLGRALAMPRGRVLGGSSSTNAMLWYRGSRADYDAWEAAGAAGWGYDALLPYFRRSESRVGGDPAYRGLEGPMRVGPLRSEEHTSELQSLMRISYAVFCLTKKKKNQRQHTTNA